MIGGKAQEDVTLKAMIDRGTVMHLSPNSTLVFVIGAPRSGTTLLTRLININKRFLITDENGFITHLVHLYWVNQFKRGDKEVTGVFPSDLISRDYKDFYLQWLKQNIYRISKNFYEDLAKELKLQDVSFWGEKHPHMFDRYNVSIYKDCFPGAKYIYILRDPRDVANSISRMNKWTIEKSMENAFRFCKKVNKISKIFGEDVFVLRYEDLVKKPLIEIKKIFDHFEISLDDNASKEILSMINKNSHDLSVGIKSKEKINSWINDPPKFEKIISIQKEKYYSEIMKELNYELEVKTTRSDTSTT